MLAITSFSTQFLQDSVGLWLQYIVYNGIEPNTRHCELTPPFCEEGSLLSDGDIGPTQSVDVSDPDQVRRFFVWHRDNGSVTLQFRAADDDPQCVIHWPLHIECTYYKYNIIPEEPDACVMSTVLL